MKSCRRGCVLKLHDKHKERENFMRNRKHLFGKTGAFIAAMFMCFGMTAMAAPSVQGDDQLSAVKDQVVSAEYTITSDEPMENAMLQLSYDKDVLTYMSGSGGNNFSGSGGNGMVQLTSKPGDDTASFAVKFKCKADEETSLEVISCIITVDGKELDVLTGETMSEEDPDAEGEEGEEEEDEERASFVIDGRTFYVRRPDSMDDFDTIKMMIQGIESRVLKHNELDLYLIKLRSDNGSYRDHFVYHPDTGNIVPFVERESGTDDIIFIEPDANAYIPTRYVYVDMPWGAKYSIPAYKHVIVDGIDEIFDDSNVYLVYGINQDGEKGWYSYDYDTDSVQKFDDVAYQGEQDYIAELERTVQGLNSEMSHQLERYNTDMGRRLTIIMIMTFLLIVLVNVTVIQYLRMRKMQMPEQDEDEEEYFTGTTVKTNLEENETDVDDLEEEEDIELEIIDLDDLEEEEE